MPLLACDSSSYGISSALSQLDNEGNERPIAFYSRTLNSSERIFAQIDKEALFVIVGAKKFHDHIYSRHNEIHTDQINLFLEFLEVKKKLPPFCPQECWSIMLNNYNCTLVYCPGKSIGNADGLSRLPLSVKRRNHLILMKSCL